MGKQTRLHRIHHNMKNRCYNKNFKEYKNYGGRGITICSEWLDSEKTKIKGTHISNISKGLIVFKKWALENGYSDELTLDRIDPNGNYEPSNCRWVSRKEQNNNRTNNHYITYKGKTQSISKWAEELGIKRQKIVDRLWKLGWSIERALTTK